MRALRIYADTTITEFVLPDADAQQVIHERIGSTGAVDQAVYHRRACLHVHGEGQRIGLKENLVAWALASAWRRVALYPSHGPTVIIGRTGDGGGHRWMTTLRNTSRPLRTPCEKSSPSGLVRLR